MTLGAGRFVAVKLLTPLLLAMACGSDPAATGGDADPGSARDAQTDAAPQSDAGPQVDVHSCDAPVACGTCEDDLVCMQGRCVEEGSVIVANDAELAAAITNGTTSNILIAPGTYSLADMAKGIDRTANPLTIQGLNPDDRPVFQNATQSLILTRHVSFQNLSFVATEDLGGIWFSDGGGNGTGGDAHDIAISCSDFTALDPGDKNNSTPTPNYASGMTSLFRFSNFATYNYTLRNIDAEYVYQIGDFRMNGNVVIDNLDVDFWYFDGIRIIASGEEGYVEGNRLIANVDLTNNLAVYNEMGNNAPHPDSTQVFNTGSSANNTNPSVQNLVFYRNRFNPGQFRSSNAQAGLSQSPMTNVGYIENIWATKGSVHGISLEGGGRGVLIERNTIADVDWQASPWIRIFRTDSQIIVADSFFPSGFNTTAAGANANRLGFELDDLNNQTSSSYDEFFNGPSSLGGIASLVTMFTPTQVSTIGALNVNGEWRGGAHRPMRARAPILASGTGQFSVTTLHEPTLQSPDQTAVGGDLYSRFDLRWSQAGSNAWTVITDVSESDVVQSVSRGAIDVQTRCVNSAGEGLWSFTAAATVN